MSGSRNTTRYLRIGFAALLIFSAAQVSWWIVDQWRFTNQTQAELRLLHEANVAAARRLLEAGVDAAQVADLFPQLEVTATSVALDPAVDEQLAEQGRRRLNRYLWEGGFFFVVLLASISVIGRALRHDAALRRRQQNFLASVSHELKSPLAAARVAAETLELRDPPPDQRRHQVARILRSVGRLERMITNLLETVRLEEGELALRPHCVDLGEVIAPVLRADDDRRSDLGAELQVDVASGILVLADDEAVRTVLRNLLSNAFKAVEQTDKPVVRVCAYRVKDGAVLEVHDNGKGFESRHASVLFEKFYRPGDEIRRGGRGAGLGLHIVKEVMLRSGGSVQAMSDGPGRGACLRTTWPLGKPS